MMAGLMLLVGFYWRDYGPPVGPRGLNPINIIIAQASNII